MIVKPYDIHLVYSSDCMKRDMHSNSCSFLMTIYILFRFTKTCSQLHHGVLQSIYILFCIHSFLSLHLVTSYKTSLSSILVSCKVYSVACILFQLNILQRHALSFILVSCKVYILLHTFFSILTLCSIFSKTCFVFHHIINIYSVHLKILQ